jgi:hypothetical protein
VDGADQVVLTTCPRDCYDACGIAVVKRNGSIRHVRGDPDHSVSRGKLCRKCSIGYNGAFLDPQARLTRPLRRIGAKGEGRFEPVSWDEALAAIAGRLERIVAGPGPRTILNAHYTGTFSLLAYFFPLRLVFGLILVNVLGQGVPNVNKQRAVAIAGARADFSPTGHQVRLVRRGIPPRAFWVVSLYTRQKNGDYDRVTVVLVDANTGKVSEVRRTS